MSPLPPAQLPARLAATSRRIAISTSRPAQQVFVRLQSGVLIVITQPLNPALNRGMRVYVEGFGNDARVVPA